MKNPLFILFLLALPLVSFAQNGFSDFSENTVQPSGERLISPKKYRAVALDLSVFQNSLEAAPDWFEPSQVADNEPVMLQIPMPDGSSQAFKIYRADVLHPDLAKKYPFIKSYAGQGLDDRTATIRFDVTQFGFHAMILSGRTSSIFIDPLWKGDTEHYQAYFKSDFEKKGAAAWKCGFHEKGQLDLPKTTDLTDGQLLVGDCGKLRRYRLALACTGEYAAFYGGTTAGALAGEVTTMTRINGVYEKDLSITMQIVANNNLVIFLNAATDPYDNSNLSTMIEVNQTQCNSKIGTNNYDVGHVLSTSGDGGLAYLSVPCTADKAKGGTGLTSPIGDAYDIDFVAHEMGHEFGGLHTFNNNCSGNIDPAAAGEVGSGTTIMAYAGVCAPNVQNHSDDYFYALSLKSMSLNVVSGNSSTCPVQVMVANNKPTATAPTDKTIPVSTPFFLTGSATDADNDALTYTWEQIDVQTGQTMPPAATNSTGPMFRSFKGTTDPTRHFPNLTTLASGATPTWERLPSVTRAMNFRLTVRDNHMGGGCTAEDDIKISTSATSGPFVVTAPNTTGITWNVGSTQTVTWNVANTTAAPVSCANVKILLSTDGGLTYPITLLNTTANNGTAQVTVPNNPSTTCRARVESVGNVFFDISDKNFTIATPPNATFVSSASPASQTVCTGATAVYTINLQSIAGFNNPVSLSVAGQPSGSTVAFSQNPATPNASPTLTVSNLTASTSTSYTLTITAASGVTTQNQTVSLTVLPGAPMASVALSSPSNGASGILPSGSLSWAATALATSYLLEISTNPNFSAGSIVVSTVVNSTSFSPSNLASATVYYWRVRPQNVCGDGPISTFFSFQTANLTCQQNYFSIDTPLNIDTLLNNVQYSDSIVSKITVPLNATIADVDVTVIAQHSWVGDLEARLTSPSGQTRSLFVQPGVPDLSQYGCDQNNLSVTFDDEATKTSTDFENTCNTSSGQFSNAISGSFQPIDAFSTLDGATAQGDWKLTLLDRYAGEDGGNLTTWGLTFCTKTTPAPSILLKNLPLSLLSGASASVTKSLLEAQLGGTAAQAVFTLISLPQNGVLKLNGSNLTLGGSFTQADLNAGLVTYQHGGSAAVGDSFQFNLLDNSGKNWLANQTFVIQILQNTLAGSLVLTQNVACAGGSSAAVQATATGGTAPLSYSLNGGNFQPNGVFSGLSAGNYTVVVRDANGFTLTTNTVVANNPLQISVNVSVNTDDVTATATGGTGGLSYSIDGQNFVPSGFFENLANGVYTIVVKDANGCTASGQAVVAVNTLLIGAQIQSQITCNGSSDGAILVTAGGGSGNYAFSLNGDVPQTTGLFENLAAGSYQVVVTDNSGFSASSNILVLNDPTLLTASSSTSYYQITASATGGTGAYSYSLDGQSFQSSPIFHVAQNGSYTIYVRDQAGCVAFTTALIQVPNLMSGAAVTASILCFGETSGSILVTATGGQPPYSYSLDGLNFQSSNQFGGLAAGDFTVTTKDAAGFTTTSTTTISQPTALVVTASVFGKTITASASGGTGLIQFSLNGQDFYLNNMFENLANGLYTIFVEDNNGCISTTTTTVNYAPVVVATTVKDATCFGNSDGSISATATGGIAPFLFSTDGQNFGTNAFFIGLAAGSYTIYVKDATGAVTTTTATVGQPAQLVASATVLGSTITVAAQAGLTYSLDGGTFQANNIFQNVAAGTHTISIKNASGCTASTTVTVSANTLIISTLDLNQPSCNGGSNGSFTLCLNGGTVPYNLSIFPNVGQQTVVSGACNLNVKISGLAAGSYQISATDAQTFSQILTVVLPQPSLLVASTLVNQNTATLTATGGTPPFSYSIDGSNFQSSNVFSNLPVGNYTATVKDANGCTTTTTFIIMTISTGEATASDFGLRVFPNPSGGLFQLVVNQGVSSIFDLKISDAAGRFLMEKRSDLSQPLDLSSLPDGVYWLSLSDGERRAVRRLVILK